MVAERSLYDCLNAKVKMPRITCDKGHVFDSSASDGSLSVWPLLNGKPLIRALCQECPDFDQMDGGAVVPGTRGWRPSITERAMIAQSQRKMNSR